MKKPSSKILEIRTILRISQSQLAAKLKVTRGCIGHYETGRRSPNSKILIKLLNFCKKHNIAIETKDLRPDFFN